MLRTNARHNQNQSLIMNKLQIISIVQLRYEQFKDDILLESMKWTYVL